MELVCKNKQKVTNGKEKEANTNIKYRSCQEESEILSPDKDSTETKFNQ